ncbi:MAG: response regulator [Proteobacteria bacterium]|nr:response regulator [Pseudomonadota bacterium]
MATRSASTGRLLVVSQASDASTLAALLREAGHAVSVAPGEAEALAAIATRAPDLLLIDSRELDCAGIGLVASLAQRDEDVSLPVLVLGLGHDAQALRLRAFGAGAADVMAMPIDEDELLARIRVHLHQKQSRERLAHALRSRQELFNLIAHDIKNPLTSVLFAREMLAMPDCKPERVARYLQIIDESTHEALDYVRAYLESQSPDSAEPGASSRRSSLRDTLRWLAARYELQFEAQGMRLRSSAPEGDACVAIDAQLLRHVGENLLGNALKYAGNGGDVELLGRPGRDGHWQLVVQDRGPGVPVVFQPSLFKPFQRLDGHDAPGGLSNGLGLALARQIVLGAGGRLCYEDREGGGARFTVELPAAACSELGNGDQTP